MLLNKQMLLNKKIALIAPLLAVSAGWSIAAQAEEIDTAKELEALKAQVEALADALDAQSSTSVSKTTLGGYGEHHYNGLNGSGNVSDKDQVDAHRYVLFINHEYSDDLKFYSEFELEHGVAGEGQPGEVELEQAFIEKTFASGDRLSVGLFLIPVGVLNETHEPDTFYGVERNNIENRIIPTTWWETGVMYSGANQAFSYDVAVHSGLKSITLQDPEDNTSGAFSSIRGGRQKSAEADARELAATARIKASPVKGLDLSATVQRQNDLSGDARLGIDATLLALTAAYQKDKFSTKVLYAQWDINDDIETLATGASEQEGFNLELAYKIRNDVGVFTRYSEWDTAAADSAESGVEQVDVGVNYWLHPRVVVKADYQIQTQKADSDNELKGVNLGLGWSF